MKKIIFTTAAIAMLGAGIMAQGMIGKPVKKNLSGVITPTVQRDYSKPDLKSGQKPNRGCATPVPGKDWDEAFNKMVEQHKQDMATAKTTATTYTIPIIFHIIYSTGEVEGGSGSHNVSQAQVQSQIPILNADYNGTGYNSSQYVSLTYSSEPAFYQYASITTNSVEATSKASNGSIKIGSSGITFCLATKNPSGTTLAEPGIDRVTWESISGATNPASSAAIQTLFDGTIKPATIWNPQLYFNVWVSDGGTSGLLGYATFPPLTATTPLNPSFGETVSSPSTTDGVWMAYNALGNTGTAAAPYNYGRTLTHESGHYFGLRHVWGDGDCLTDYCNDTPPASAANYCPWPTTYPYLAGSCTGTPNNTPDGDMFMAFMDYSDDAAMWMFTPDQVARFQTALANSPWRSGLTTSAANLCNITLSAPTASFTPPATICATQNVVFTDNSTGPPTSWNWSVTPTTGVTITTSSIQNPTFNFTTAGSYTVTDDVTNSAGSNSASHVVTVTTCTTSSCDTVSHIGSTDTLVLYTTGTSTACTHNGYLNGTSCNGFTGLAESYALSDFPTGTLQVKGAIIIFYRESTTIGTHGTATHTATTISMVNGTTPSGTSVTSKAITYANIAAVTGVQAVDYAGTPGLEYTDPIMVPYVAMFTTPISLTSAFCLDMTIPTASGDSLGIFSGVLGINANNTAYFNYSGGWTSYSTYFPNTTLAIIPIVCPVSTTGIESNQLGSNINLFPNPNNGQFTFAVSLAEATNLNFTVLNTLGQVVYTKTENNVLNAVLSCDLSHLAKGVYYANITDSNNNRTMKKIIIE
jgi:type IX secretion system substrate protein/pregnancy-associated plasma protein-A/PKD domain-containing protein